MSKLEDKLGGDHEFDILINSIKKLINAVGYNGIEKAEANCLGVKMSCYNVKNVIRLDIKP